MLSNEKILTTDCSSFAKSLQIGQQKSTTSLEKRLRSLFVKMTIFILGGANAKKIKQTSI